jgi:hypothetical protein
VLHDRRRVLVNGGIVDVGTVSYLSGYPTYRGLASLGIDSREDQFAVRLDHRIVTKIPLTEIWDESGPLASASGALARMPFVN